MGQIKVCCMGFMPWVIPEMPKIDQLWKEVFSRVTSSDTEVALRWLDKRYGDMYFSCKYPYFGVRNAFFIADGAFEAEREGYDAVALSPFTEWGIRQALTVCNIPVTDAVRSSVFIALTLGEKFAVLSNEKRLIPWQEVTLKDFGLEGFGISRPVRGGEWTLEELMRAYQNPEKVVPEVIIPKVEKLAKECIDDGADVLITGCALLGPLLSFYNYTEIGDTGVPVIDSTTAAVKMAEAMAGLKKNLGLSKSTVETCVYSPPPMELVEAYRKIWGMEEEGHPMKEEKRPKFSSC